MTPDQAQLALEMAAAFRSHAQEMAAHGNGQAADDLRAYALACEHLATGEMRLLNRRAEMALLSGMAEVLDVWEGRR